MGNDEKTSDAWRVAVSDGYQYYTFKPQGVRDPEPLYTASTIERLSAIEKEQVIEAIETVMEERAKYFDRTKGHFDREDAARSYRATKRDVIEAVRAALLHEGQG